MSAQDEVTAYRTQLQVEIEKLMDYETDATRRAKTQKQFQEENPEGYSKMTDEEVDQYITAQLVEKRDRYVKDTIKSLGDGLREVKGNLGIEDLDEFKKMGLVDKAKFGKKLNGEMEAFGTEFNQNKLQYVSCLFYCVKDEFRADLLSLLGEVFTGVF